MSNSDNKTDAERQAHIEEQIASWERVGYKRHQLIILDNGHVLADPDKLETELTLEVWEKLAAEKKSKDNQ